MYGVNVDDLGDYRPGQRAAKRHEAKAPLVEAGLTKAEIRELSRAPGLSTWDRPAAACLSSRIPYGTPVTMETVKTVERGEEAIKALGFRQFRVRYHGELVRIEIAPEELERGADAGDGARVHGDLQAAGLSLRDGGSGRLPAGIAQFGFEEIETRGVRRSVIAGGATESISMPGGRLRLRAATRSVISPALAF